MRQLIGAGTPKEAAARGRVLLLVVHSEEILAMVLFAVPDADARGDFGLLIVAVTATTCHDHNGHIVNGLVSCTS
jgi:hypothetical protein